MIWKTRDGREIPLRDLSDVHLKNAIDFVNEHYPAWKEYFGLKKITYMLRTMNKELRYRKLNSIFNNPDSQEDIF